MWTRWIIFLVFGLTQGQLRLDPLVNTKQGLIRGQNASDGEYSMFLGIPYAIVDENNPFGAAVPHPAFEGVFSAYDESAMCPQIEEFNNTIVGTLDCLHLNVYVPHLASSSNRLPVLVWIHGGGFAYGFSNRYLYGPKFLVQHNVILVTLNYRLGPYGFMCLNTPEVPGNQGLKDQVLALRWIKENIAEFDGDANKITIMGESAGAASVEYHVYFSEPQLYNQVILQSGSILGSWTMRGSDETAPLQIAHHLGFQTDDSSEALNFLKGVDTRLVIDAASELELEFGPCIEQDFEGVEAFVTGHPLNMDVPNINNVPVLAGFNTQEYLFMYGNEPASFYNTWNGFNTSLNEAFHYNEEFREMEDIVRHFYIGDEEVNENLKWEIIDFSSDIYFNYPMEKSMKKFIEHGAKAVFRYVFSYSGGRNFVKNKLNITSDGASHADEIGYLFDYFEKDTPSEDDQRIIDQITTLWTNFVKYGDPTPDTTELLYVKWNPMTLDTYNYLDIDKELALKKRPFNARMAFWDLFYKANEDKVKIFGVN
ncbi:esterase FE4-like [Melitaea cinxia]|uniref:esterase FE4-like n=1 Tax=Melitaea cinxia TaxID=113334 RepID=UPI001E273D4A|nr:esterase FE4-like [Melitaea cinxia]